MIAARSGVRILVGAMAALALVAGGVLLLFSGLGTGMQLTSCWGGCRADSALGAPLPGLTPEQLASFESGRWWFAHDHTLREGLGPFFNARSCRECHQAVLVEGALLDVTGGAGRDTRAGPGGSQALHAGRIDPDGTFDALIREGGEVRRLRTIQELVPGCELPPQSVPPDAPLVSRRQAPPLFGLGLIDAIPDEAILAQAVAKGDGVRGRPNLGPAMDPFVNDHVVGRFGWKAEFTSVLEAVAQQYVVHLGVTSPYAPMEVTSPIFWVPGSQSPQVSQLPQACLDALAWPYEPNAKGEIALALADYVRGLRPPPPGPRSPASDRGRVVFERIGCAACHLPSYRTAADPIASLAHQEVWLYSDLLLHDLGPALADGFIAGAARGGDWRTTPLWGLRLRPFLLHDGRYPMGRQGLIAAIRDHGGEAGPSAARFAALERADLDDLLAFLLSL